MEMDTSRIVAYANNFTKERQNALTVSDEQIMRKAASMARRGYVHTATSIAALKAYMEGYGVLLSGNVGVGKTFFFECAEPEIPILNMNIAYLWSFQQLEDFMSENRGTDILIDDIRGETGSNYGVKYDVLLVAIEHRLSTNARTHFTTNMTNEELIKVLDYRTMDRIYGIAKPFVFKPTASMRDATPNETFVRKRSENNAR